MSVRTHQGHPSRPGIPPASRHAGDRRPEIPEPCIHRLVTAQAQRTPNATALVASDGRLTYADLDARSNRVAHVLRSLGVGPETPVGLCAPRSVELVTGALGILKAGGAYVALDPASPADRLSMHLEDAGTPLLLTSRAVAGRVPGGAWRTIAVEEVLTQPSDMWTGPPAAEAEPRHLAYVIFTSGSTGRPKGVEITHGSLLNLVSWHRRAFAVTSDDRATVQASPGFDAAVWEIWPYLAAGAALYLVDDGLHGAPEALRDWMVAHRITIAFLPTALAERMIELRWPADTALRTMLTGADTLRRYPPPDLPFALVNNYGPTECTVVATSGIVPPGGPPDRLPAIGRPIDGTRLYIVDRDLRPVADGTPGELLIGGAGVARGYLNRPDLTAERFLPDPLAADGRGRVYRTGDLARRLPDGQIGFLGRIDDQIKIRGYRIEPREITLVLERHPGVKTSVVGVHADASGDKQLVAYVVPAMDARPSARVLRTFLRRFLPEHMVPSAFVSLPALPVTARGKLDRSALPAPSAANVLRDESEDSAVPPSDVEERVAGILGTLLGGRPVGLDDNFFEIGGHSLLGAQTIARIREAFGVDVPLRILFDHPTAKGLAAEIERLFLHRLEAMSEEEAERLVASFPDAPAE